MNLITRQVPSGRVIRDSRTTVDQARIHLNLLLKDPVKIDQVNRVQTVITSGDARYIFSPLGDMDGYLTVHDRVIAFCGDNPTKCSPEVKQVLQLV